MELPVDLSNTFHKFGGKITRIESIHHEKNKPEDGFSRDHWWFVGDVDWTEGDKTEGYEIAPYHLCHGEVRGEVDALLELLSNYLCEHGTWNYDGDPRGWTAHRA
jgi:hypothetical protein